MVELGDEFGIPPYLFLTSGASFLGLMLYHLTRHDLVDAELKNSDWVGYSEFCQTDSYLSNYKHSILLLILTINLYKYIHNKFHKQFNCQVVINYLLDSLLILF